MGSGGAARGVAAGGVGGAWVPAGVSTGAVLPGSKFESDGRRPHRIHAARIESMPPAGAIHITRQDAALCLPVGDCRDCLVVLDPPYVGTSGYQNDATRATVLELARAWDAAGALVLLHEACPLAEQLGHGWHSRPIDRLRRATSTFWAGEQREWLTTNRQPVSWPAEQMALI